MLCSVASCTFLVNVVIDQQMDNGDNLAMSGKFPHLSLCARVVVTCLTLVGLGIAAQALTSREDSAAVPPAQPQPVDLVAATTAKPVATVLLPEVPSPTPTPMPRSIPVWGRAIVDTPLRLQSDAASPAVEFVPKASQLRLLRAEDDELLVYYGGDGHDHQAFEGWVAAADVVAASAPKWVQVRQQTTLWSDASGGAGSAAALPKGAELEVLGEEGKRLHVYYLGDGLSHDVAEGWVDPTNLGPAGPMLLGEKLGVRVLTKADVVSIRSGAGVWLRVPYRSQFDGSPSADANCGPASVGMTLQYYHQLVPTSEVRAVADRMQGTSDPESGFAIEYLGDTVDHFGLKGVGLLIGKNLRRWTLDDLRNSLSQGHPVIPELRFRQMPGRSGSDYSEDHYVVLTGMYKGDFVYNDSVDSDGPGYGRVITTEDLKRAWGTSDFPFAAFAVSAQ